MRMTYKIFLFILRYKIQMGSTCACVRMLFTIEGYTKSCLIALCSLSLRTFHRLGVRIISRRQHAILRSNYQHIHACIKNGV